MKISDKKHSSKGLETVIARSLDEIEAIRPIWEQMQKSEPFPVPNSDIDRFLTYICAREEAVQPYVMLFSDNNCAKAMVIGRIERSHLECKIGYKSFFKLPMRFLTIVYGGILGQPTDEVCRIMIDELKNVLKSREADVLLYNRFRTNCRFYHIIRSDTKPFCQDYFSIPQPNWQTEIPDSVENYYKTLSSHRRRYISYYSKRLEKKYPGQVRLEYYRNEEDLEYIISTASSITDKTYKSAMGAGFNDNNIVRSLLRQAARNHWLCAYILYVADEPCAFEYGVKYERVFFAEYMGFDPKWRAFSIGTILWLKVIEDLSNDPDISLLDYGFGNAGYKERFGTESHPEVHVMNFARRIKPIASNFVWTLFKGTSHLLSFIVTQSGIVLKLKRRWRNVLQPAKNNKHKTGANKS